MGMTINHFMWGYQSHFRVVQQCLAERLFELLDSRFSPEVFLVGILVDDRDERYPACVEPEKGYWIESKAFDKTQNILKQCHDESLKCKTMRDSVQGIIDKKNNEPLLSTYIVGHPSKVEGYLVSVVLKLQTTIIKLYPSLATDSVSSSI